MQPFNFVHENSPATNSKAIVPINARLLMTIGSACINISNQLKVVFLLAVSSIPKSSIRTINATIPDSYGG
jgi:hypothetical protein